MKIGIVTVYNAYNCGSFLQAFALCTILKKSNDVCFVRNFNFSRQNRFYYVFLQFIKYTLKGKFKKAFFLLKRYFIFQKCRMLLPIKNKYSDMDLLIYGSDTIWNIDDPYFMKEWKRYWGFGISQEKITYAASAGGTQEEKILEKPELGQCVSEFSGIGVRDEHTYNIVKKILPDGKTINRVVDPTLLVDIQEYKKIAKNCKEKDFILVYAFADIKQEAIAQIKKFAKQQGKKIIAFGDEFPADKNVPFDPRILISYYEKADYVITNTFHGTIFSIIYNKKFVSYGKEKKKVALLLEEFGLSDQNIDSSNDILSVINNEIDYDRVNGVILKKREESLEYLNAFTK